MSFTKELSYNTVCKNAVSLNIRANTLNKNIFNIYICNLIASSMVACEKRGEHTKYRRDFPLARFTQTMIIDFLLCCAKKLGI